MRLSFIGFIVLVTLAGCGGAGTTLPETKTPDATPPPQTPPAEQAPTPKDDSTESPVTEKMSPISQGPDGEMIPGVNVGGSSSAASAEALPQHRDGLIRATRTALREARLEEAVAISDTLVILYHDDPEILELRSEVLLRKGDVEPAMLDLKRCCELGRNSCCAALTSITDAVR